LACNRGNEVLVKYLVELGSNINKECWNHEISLFSAYNSGNKAIVKYLIELGSDINKESMEGETPLSMACLKWK